MLSCIVKKEKKEKYKKPMLNHIKKNLLEIKKTEGKQTPNTIWERLVLSRFHVWVKRATESKPDWTELVKSHWSAFRVRGAGLVPRPG